MSINFRDPWVDAGQFADALVKELQREVIGGHPLWKKEVRAIARRTDSDDALFEITGNQPTYAVVHLTWSGTSEYSPSFPDVKLFSTLDQWMQAEMIPDHQA